PHREAPSVETLRAEDAAGHLVLHGAFNWNSTSVDAWRMQLTHALESAGGDVEGAWGSGGWSTQAAVVRHNFAEMRSAEFVADSALAEEAQWSPTRRATWFRTGVREVESGRISALADAIVAGLRARGRPFPSISAFLDSGLLEDALRDSGFNEDYPRHANGHVSQSDLAALLAPSAAVRSDTFLIRAYGEVLNPLLDRVESRAALEAIVQR